MSKSATKKSQRARSRIERARRIRRERKTKTWRRVLSSRPYQRGYDEGYFQ